MAHNILLTSLSAMEHDLPVRYFSVQNESGSDYFDVLLDAEAGIKTVLSRYDIDEIVIIGSAGSFNEGEDREPISLRQGSELRSSDMSSLSTYGLLQARIAQYADKLALNQEEENLPEEVREKLIRFIQDFLEGNADLKTKELNRLFDTLAQSDQIYENFWTALFEACPELRENPGSCKQWVKKYLYTELEPSSKLEFLPVNEKVGFRFIPETEIEDGERWVDSMMTMEESIVEDKKDINLYVSVNSEDAADTFVLLSMLDILISMPESGVQLKKLFTVRSLQRHMTGIVRDDTDGFGVADLFHAIRAFLKYGKADMIVDIWKKSGEQNESIADMIYAMRDVDVGLSMCNILEVEEGILRLRELFKSEKFWRESGRYGMLFTLIAESIREDYGVLLEGDGELNLIELVKWAYRHQFYQQTLTLIESKTPENLVKSGIFYYCDDEKHMDHVIQLFTQKRLELKPFEYYKIDEIDHYFIKTYDRSRVRRGRGMNQQQAYAALRTQSVENKDPSLITGFTACDKLETLQNTLYAYYQIGNVRNKISHGDANAMSRKNQVKSESGEVSALVWMKDSIDFFIDSYEKAIAEVEDKNPHVIIISGDVVRKAAESMRYNRR